MLTLFTDTDNDFTPETAAQYGYKLISMPYSVDGSTITYPYEDFQEFDSHAFYDVLRGGVLPTTSAISEERYIQYFEPEFKQGNDIFYVHFSAAMTITFNEMNKAVAKLLAQYPERKFYQVDTKAITLGSYGIVCEIAEMFKNGATPEEMLAWADREVPHFATYFFADDLKFFRKSGRVGGLAATMGTLIGIRPIITMNDEGKMVSIGKETGRAKAMKHLVDKVAELGDDIKSHHVVVGHTDAPEIAKGVGDMLTERFGEDLKIDYVITNPTAGSHCGPNGVGVSFHAVHR